MWFCVMTFLSWHKELLSWICFVESWPQGFVREMNCSQVLEILRQFTSGTSVRLKATANLCILFWNQPIWWLKCELSVRTYGAGLVWLELVAWGFKERILIVWGWDGGCSRLTPGSWASSTFLPPFSDKATLQFLLHCCSWCSHIYPGSSTRQETLKSLFWKSFFNPPVSAIGVFPASDSVVRAG